MKRMIYILSPCVFVLGLLLMFGAVGGLEEEVLTVAQCIGVSVAGLFMMFVSGKIMEGGCE